MTGTRRRAPPAKRYQEIRTTRPARRCAWRCSWIVCERHAFRKYFAEPVPSRNLAGYEHVVARPMDLGTIEKRLKSGAYAGSTGAARAVSDIRAVWHACALYNEPRSPIYRAGTILDGIWTGCHEKAIASTLKEEHFNLLERQAGALARERSRRPRCSTAT